MIISTLNFREHEAEQKGVPMINYAMFSKTGERPHNEDAVRMLSEKNRSVFALGDGLGGHGGGDVASACATEEAVDVFRRERNPENYLSHAFEAAQGRIMEKKQSGGTMRNMKSTMVLLQIENGCARWGHIGDSRLYYFRNGRMQGRTLDHSVPQMLALSGQIREDEIRHHGDRNRVLRSLGTSWEESSAYTLSKPVKADSGTAFLMCSDGFWELIQERDMERTLNSSESVAQWLKKMEMIVLENGTGTKMDNYSAICIYIE